MAVDINKAIDYMYYLRSQGITYSMEGSRIGTDGTADCSGAIYISLRNAGATNAGYVVSTESMHDWLIQNGYKLIAANQEWSMQRGDIVIFGYKGQSAGAGGHVVMAVDGTNVIHCNYDNNGVTVNNENTLPYSMGWYVYRYEGAVPEVEEFTGWKNDNNQWQYYISGKKTIESWQKVGEKWYHFNGVGDMQTGWFQVGGKWYYADASGAMVTGWQLINGRWYHLDGSGAMVEGWLPSGSTWYYLSADGSMAQGWFKDKGGTWYYLSQPDGHMVTGRQSIDGKEYDFDKSGKCLNP
ncbi:MAG: NlpC/P60 family protein [Enterococcaceae bacterium]|jgi:glucan-binding YG repeat protein|nr:NlpC/P60 family protein [Enterococcaceae bacterium]